MRVLMVVLRFPPAGMGGSERQCLRQAEALAKRGHHVTILTGWWMFLSARKEEIHGVQIRRIGWLMPLTWLARKWHDRLKKPEKINPPSSGTDSNPIPPPPKKKFRWMVLTEYPGMLSFFAETFLLLKFGGLQADVVHVHESYWIAGYARWIALRLKVPIFCKEATSPPLGWGEPLVPWANRWKTYRLGCCFIALTQRTAEQLKEFGISTSHILQIPNGIELPEQLATPKEHALGIYVGNFTQLARTKAFDVLIAAIGEALKEETELRFCLYGRGDTAVWRQFAETCGAIHAIEFAGESAEIGKKLQEGGFFVLPSRIEGLSNALLEAMATGLPVIVSDIPANTEVVRDRVDGIVVPVGDPHALALAILELYRDPELRAHLGKAARARMAETFDIQRVAEQLEMAYQGAQKV